MPGPTTGRRTRPPSSRPIDPDAAIRWGCSGRGWNCCVDKDIALQPYDLVRLRHALGRPAQEIVNAGLVTFDWNGDGALVGHLRRTPAGDRSEACVFYEEITNVDAAALAERDPGLLASLPGHVGRAARSGADGAWRVAGLCRVHAHRPQVCRGFPFQRDPVRERWADGSALWEVNRCGSCALAEPTTPRAVTLANAIDEFWMAEDAYRGVMRYLFSRGAANVTHADYVPLPLDAMARTETWLAMFVADAPGPIADRFPGQWRHADDRDGDRALFVALLEAAMDRVDAAVAASGLDPATLGARSDPALPRPDLADAFAPDHPLLPVVTERSPAAGAPPRAARSA